MSFAPHCQRLQKTLGAPLVFHLPNASPTRSSMRPSNGKASTTQICSGNSSNSASKANVDARHLYVHNRSEPSGTTTTTAATRKKSNNNKTVWTRENRSLRHVKNREMYSSLGIEKIHEILRRLVSYGFETSADIAKMQPWQLRVLKKTTPQIDRIYLQAFPVWGTHDYYDEHTNKALRQFADCAIWLEYNEIYLIITSFYLGCDGPNGGKVPGFKCFICQYNKELTSLDDLRWHVWLHHRHSPDMAKAMADSRERYWNLVDLSPVNRVSKKRGQVIDLCMDSDSDDSNTKQSNVSHSNTKRVDQRTRRRMETSHSMTDVQPVQRDTSLMTMAMVSSQQLPQGGTKNTGGGSMSTTSGAMNIGHFHPCTRPTEEELAPLDERGGGMQLCEDQKSNAIQMQMQVDSEEIAAARTTITTTSTVSPSTTTKPHNTWNSSSDHMSVFGSLLADSGDNHNNNSNNINHFGFHSSMSSGPDWFGENEFLGLAQQSSNGNSNTFLDSFGNDFLDDNGPSSFGLANDHEGLQDTSSSWPGLLDDSFSNGL